MNPLTKVKLINELNDREVQLGVKESVSWHSEYKDSAWIFIGGFPYELTEGDIICVFSQYGEIANINLVRDKKTGKSKGFCFICYEDQRSTILAVDNFNGIKIKGRTIRVDHVKNYRPPKDSEDIDDVTKQLREDGCAPQRPPSSSSDSEEEEYAVVKKMKKDKKEEKKKKNKKNKKEKKALKEERREAEPALQAAVRVVKHEQEDSGYEKYAHQGALQDRRAHQDPNSRAPADRHGDRERDGRGGEGSAQDSKRIGREEREQKMERLQREREAERERDRDRERERDRDRERPTDRETKRERDRETNRERETERDRDRERTREQDRERERNRERDRGRDKCASHRERSRERGYRRN